MEDKSEIYEKTENSASKTSPIIVLDRGISNDGRDYWLYLAIEPGKYEAFALAASGRQSIRFSDYGKILKLGYGKEVPASVKIEMKEKYGCDDHYMEKFMQKTHEEKEKQRINEIVAMLKKEM